MNSKHEILIYLWIFLPRVFTDIICGKLKVDYVYHVASTDCKIHLSPSTDMSPFITESKFYRWIHIRNLDPRVILQKNAGPYDTLKYGESNYTLLVRNLSQSDEGRYRVHCWTNDNVNYFSPEVTVKIPAIIPTTEKSAPSPLNDAGIGATAIVVVSVCAVLVVAIMAATVLLVMRRRKNEQEGVTPLVNEESASRRTQSIRGEDSVYNEIDINEMRLDYAKVNKQEFTSPALASVPSRDIPVLPTRPSDKSENEYATVDDADVAVTKSRKHETGYVEVVVKSPTDIEQVLVVKTSKGTDNSDASTLIKENNNSDKSDSESKPGSKLECKSKAVIEADFPVYAKVQKKRAVDKINENDSSLSGLGNGYNIAFPKINCSEITQSLGEDILAQRSTGNGEPVMYSNLVSRYRRVKSRQSRTSRKSLQYAILDLAGPDTDHSEDEADSGRLQPCQYASIDFDKRAFVAPVRKAPSSWYKRKNKKGKREITQ